MICAVFWCRIWNYVYFVVIYLFSLHQHTAPLNSTIRWHSISITLTQYVFMFYIHYCYSELSIFLIYIIARCTCGRTFTDIFHWPTTILLFLLYVILKYYGTLLFSLISNMFICGIFKHKCFAAVKEIYILQYSINKNKCRKQIPVPQTKQQPKHRAPSGVSWSWWGRYWLRYKSPGFM